MYLRPREVTGKHDGADERVAEEVDLDPVGGVGAGQLLKQDRGVPRVQVPGALHVEPDLKRGERMKKRALNSDSYVLYLRQFRP